MANFIEKRRHPRFKAKWHIIISRGDDFIEGETRNIAFDGISICCEEPLPLDEVVSISLEPHDQKSIVISGRVMWSDVYGIDDQETSYGVGICFVKISDEDRSRYLEVISGLIEE